MDLGDVGRTSIVACLIGESEKNVNEGEERAASGCGAGIAAALAATAIQFISPTRKEIGDMTRSIDP